MPNSFYVPGHPAQYKEERWARYESLRASGLTKNESRELSRIDHPADQKILASIARERQRYVVAFEKKSAELTWTSGQRRYYYYAGIREMYEKRGYAAKAAGQDTPQKRFYAMLMSLYHYHENKLARKKGWKPGTYDPSIPAKDQQVERVSRRAQRSYKRKDGGGKGQIKAQRARAKLRAYGFKQGYTVSASDNVKVAQVRGWIRDLRNSIQQQPERRVQFEKQIANLETQLRTAKK
jgi:hypothetical protein